MLFKAPNTSEIQTLQTMWIQLIEIKITHLVKVVPNWWRHCHLLSGWPAYRLQRTHHCILRIPIRLHTHVSNLFSVFQSILSLSWHWMIVQYKRSNQGLQSRFTLIAPNITAWHPETSRVTCLICEVVSTLAHSITLRQL